MRGSWGGGGVDHQYMLTIGSGASFSAGTELVVVGCNVEATLHTKVGDESSVVLGCTSNCTGNAALTVKDVRHYTGICTAAIAMGYTSYDVELKRLGDGRAINDDLPVSVFIVDGDTFEPDLPPQAFLLMNLDKPPGARHLPRTKEDEDDDQLQLPVFFGWACNNDGSCNGSVSSNSHCEPDKAGEGLLYCNCIPGYEGNPYVTAGCKDIDECKHPKDYPCFGVCGNKDGSFNCWCPRGYHGNASLPDGCIKSVKNTGISAIIGVSCGVGLILSVMTAFLVSKKLKHRRTQIARRKFFEQNHGQLLEQLVSQRAGIAERMIITLDELEKATHNFDKDLVVGGGGHSTVYKGILSNQHIVAIKKPKRMVQKEIDEFINEVAILSQINHRNVVKLYGCCLETEFPMLIYEFISNGTLSEHLHVEGQKSLSWDDRLRIAIETSKSLAYLHSTASTPIIHRDIKTANILLDDTLTAKVADFGASRYIPIEKSGLTTMAQGTRGYWDPVCFYTGRLTEKSDVYSFGVVLVELLTRKKPFSYLSLDDEALVVHFATLFAEGNLQNILDPQVMEEAEKEVEEVATIALACIKARPEDRPTMREVELALESIRPSEQCTLDNDIIPDALSPKDRRTNEGSARRYSMEEEFKLSASYPR